MNGRILDEQHPSFLKYDKQTERLLVYYSIETVVIS